MFATRPGVLAALALASLGTAHAADLPARMAPPAYVAPLPVFTWTGPYFGINAGYDFDNFTRVRTTGSTPFNTGVTTGNRPGSIGLDTNGFTGGGQIGYNFQLPGFGGFGGPGSGIVFGVEADAAYTDIDKSRTFVGNAGSNNTLRSQLDYLGTVRGRVGYAFNQLLVYGTGGLAYGGVENSANFYDGTNSTLLYTGRRNDMQAGFAYGGGIEYALPTSSMLNFFKSSAVTIKAEYIHYDLGKSNVNVAAVPGTAGSESYNSRFETQGDLARVGLNYKF